VAYQVASLLPEAAQSRVIIAAFGDPHFNPGQAWADAGNFYHTLYGVLVTVWDEQPHIWPDSYAPHLRSWCLHGDDICNATGLRFGTCGVSCTHETGYISSGYTRDAASWAYQQWKKLPAPSPSTPPTPPTGIGQNGPWKAIEPTLPANADPQPNWSQAVKFVACPSSSRCDAFGTYHPSSGPTPTFVLTRSGTLWAETALKDTAIDDEACMSATDCVAVSNSGDPALWSGSGTSWTGAQPPLPPDASQPLEALLTSVVCPASSQCVAAGRYYDSSANSQGLLLTGAPASWTPAKAPVPANAAANPNVQINDVACSSTSACVAVGNYTDSSGNQEGLLLDGSGTSWTAAEAPLPASPDVTGNPHVSLGPVMCPAVSSCTVVGTYTDAPGSIQGSQSLLLTGSGTSWTAIKPPLPANASADSAVFLDSGVCESTSSCIVTGTYNMDSAGYGDPLILTGHGSSWTPAEPPLPAGGESVDNLGPVTCASATECLVAGEYMDTTGHNLGLILTGAGTSWSAIRAPMPPNASQATSSYVQLNTAACESASSCVIGGSYTDTSGDMEPMIVSGPLDGT
jgi:hypothetical protein